MRTPRPITVSTGPADSAENLSRKWGHPSGGGFACQSLEHRRPRSSGRRLRLQAGGLLLLLRHQQMPTAPSSKGCSAAPAGSARGLMCASLPPARLWGRSCHEHQEGLLAGDSGSSEIHASWGCYVGSTALLSGRRMVGPWQRP